MPSTVVDWTVDKLLSQVANLNSAAASEQAKIRANRARYLETLRSLPSITDTAVREGTRAQLGKWIVNQVAIENRFNSFLSTFTGIKAKVKAFLQSVNITPPGYLGVPIVIPAAIIIAIIAGFALMALISGANRNQGKGLDAIGSFLQAAREQGYTPAQTAAGLREVRAAVDSTKPPSPFDLTGVLQAALPILVIGALIVFVAPMLKRRAA